MAKGQLSHKEVWDDSALVDSWNEALEEYKKYHSIAARGEKVQDVIGAAEELEATPTQDEPVANSHDGLPAWQPVNHDPPQPAHQAPTNNQTANVQPKVSPIQTAPAPQASQISGLASEMPQALLNQAPDDHLKNLMMSWYWAGYYTALASQNNGG